MDSDQRSRIEQLYTEMYDFLIHYAASALKNESLAEEAVQETFRIACAKPEALLDSPNPQGWLLNTLRCTVQNINRSRANANRLLASYLASQRKEITVSEDRISLDVTYENIADLEEFRLIKELAVDGKTCLEMAEARGISLSACKKRIQRAKETLRRKIKF